ncbi:MAG: DNA adenine methylase [Kiritimatiellales bacterium]
MTPFLKWAGGKRWLTQRYPELFPDNYRHYIEPFVGSGAVFFSLQPHSGVLADCNGALIETYVAIKNDWERVEAKLKEHHQKHSKDYYYKVRASSPRTPYARAARFIYLNRTCFNGLYRVNKQGWFNVPKGTKNNAVLDTDDFKGIADALSSFEITQSDFEAVIDAAAKGDFIFADPPYTVKHNANNFVKYNEELFHWNYQERLRDALLRASKRGVLIMMTNAAHKCVKDLYADCFQIMELERKSVIASDSTNRGLYKEIVVRNW